MMSENRDKQVDDEDTFKQNGCIVQPGRTRGFYPLGPEFKSRCIQIRK